MNNTRSRYLKVLTVVLALTFVMAASLPGVAQKKKRRRPAAAKAPVSYTIAANRVMRVRLNDELDSERARVGDTFAATTVDPVYSTNGVLVIPQASTVNGRVTTVTRAQKNGAPANLGVQFVSVVLPNGTHRAINGSLYDLSSSTGTSDNEGQITAHKTTNRTVKFVGGGAAGGALIGAIAGGGKGALIGAGVGAVAGIVGGRVQKGHEVKVKSGTEFGVIVNRAFTLPKYSASNQ